MNELRRALAWLLIVATIGVLAWFGWAAQHANVGASSGATPNDVPARMMAAHAAAVEQAPADCRMSWPVLAGISAIESGNGTYHGDGQTRTIGADGVVSPAIIGPALDGGQFALVPDTDQGRWDGDVQYDRAVGPTQALPSTWRGVMGERADPQNVDDAAVFTMRKVCADASGPVDDPAALTRALYSYNPDRAYVEVVTDRIAGYQQFAAAHGGGVATAKVDQPALADIARTMGDSGRRQWDKLGQTLAADGTGGYLDHVYRAASPAVSATLSGGTKKGATAPTGPAARIVAKAEAWVGRAYHPGVTAQCAYWVRQVLDEAGIHPGVTKQALDGYPASLGTADSFGPDQGQLITKSDLQPGDIVMFANTYGDWPAGTITHVGIAVGSGQMIHRPTADRPVERAGIDGLTFAGAIRLIG